MKIGSLFSGYGGLDLAVEQHFNAETVWHAEFEEATKGPWHSSGPWSGDHWYVVDHEKHVAMIAAHDGENEEQRQPDARFIALSRTALPALAQAVRAVLELHERVGARKVKNRVRIDGLRKVRGTKLVGGVCGYCDNLNLDSHFPMDPISWPCETVQALTDALKGSNDGS